MEESAKTLDIGRLKATDEEKNGDIQRGRKISTMEKGRLRNKAVITDKTGGLF